MNITPAIDFEKLSADMSAEEFQEKLCLWLQKKGLLGELRNYFRTNMITVFSKTASGSCIKKDVKPVTPKLYVVNLLIAEFLALAECHYSLSVFCAEASVVNILPNVTEDNVGNFRFESYGKFSKTEVHDILKTLGILEESDLGNFITCTYYNSTDSLLTCILTAKCSTKVTPMEICKDSHDSCAFAIENIDKLLRKNNLSYEYQLQVKCYVKQMHEKQREKSLLIEKKLKEKYKNEIVKYKQKVKSMQSSFNLEKMQLERTIFELKLLLGVCEPEQHKSEKHSSEVLTEQILYGNAENVFMFQPPKSGKKLATNLDKSKKLALTSQDVENIQLKLLLKQLQIENKNLCNQNSIYMKLLHNLSDKVDMLFCNLKTLCDKESNIYSQGNTDVQTFKNKTDDRISKRTCEELNHFDVVQEAQHKLKMLELECDSITNFKCGKHSPNIIIS